MLADLGSGTQDQRRRPGRLPDTDLSRRRQDLRRIGGDFDRVLQASLDGRNLAYRVAAMGPVDKCLARDLRGICVARTAQSHRWMWTKNRRPLILLVGAT